MLYATLSKEQVAVVRRGQKIIIMEDQTETKIRQLVDRALLERGLAELSDAFVVLGLSTYLNTYLDEDLTDDAAYAMIALVIELITRKFDNERGNDE